MTLLDSSALATPLEPGHQRAVCTSLRELAERMHGDPLIASNATSESIFNIWRSELGALLLLEEPTVATHCDSQRAIWGFLSGLIPYLHVKIKADSVFAFNESIVCPPAHTIEGKNRQVQILLDHGQSEFVQEFRALGNQKNYSWVSDESEHLKIGDWFSARVLQSNCPLGMQNINHREDSALDANSVLRRTTLEDSLFAIESFLPEYKDWVAHLTRCIVLTPKFGIGTKSSSFFNCPGHIHLSVPPSVPSGVVTLVHESAHQYFNLASRLLKLSREDAMAYSALKGMHRPVEKVLLGFHAFANALLALRMMFDRGYRDLDFDRVYQGTMKYVSNLTDVVRTLDVPEITLHGRSLVAPLLGRVRS